MPRRTTAGGASEPACFKSSCSSGTDGNSCVEIAHAPGIVHVRDAKKTGPRLALTPDTWTHFVTHTSES